MRWLCIASAMGIALVAFCGFAQQAPSDGPYKILKTVKVGGEGSFDYLFADVAERRLYIPRGGAAGRLTIFDLDTLAPVGEIPNVNAHGIAIDPKSHHGFIASQPVVMFDTQTLKVIKTIAVQGHPDRLLFDPVGERVYITSKEGENKEGGPNSPSGERVVVLNAADGSLAAYIDAEGSQEEAISDGKGHVYINVEDRMKIAVVDAKTSKVTAFYNITGKGGHCGGLVLDPKNRILFAACRVPAVMLIMNADDGKIIQTFPIGMTANAAVFNPKTMEAFSSSAAGTGTLNVFKQNSPTSYTMTQVLQTMPGAKTMAFDSKTDHIFLIANEVGPPAEGRGRGSAIPGSFTILVVGR